MKSYSNANFVAVCVLIFLIGVSPVAASEFACDSYASVLSDYVDDNGLVDYAALRDNGSRLETYARSLDALDRETYVSWSDEVKIAFWINAYNGLTVKLIVDNYPIKSSRLKSIVYPKNSIRQISGAWKEVQFRVMGESITLDTIEHKMLRAGFDEPRIHMALVCAALSCPMLRNEPYTGDNLDAQLEDQSARFMAGDTRFRIDRKAGIVRLSAIFDWFGGDFVSRYGTGDPAGKRSEKTQAVINFVSRYVENEDQEYLAADNYKIKHLDYDWSLNEQ